MKAIILVLLIQLVHASAANSATTKAEQEVSLSGTLHCGIVAIGGETTGWELVYSKDGQRSTIEVNMKAIRKAKTFDGKKVTISGKLGVKNYRERGAVRILTAKTVVLGKPDNRRDGDKEENQGSGIRGKEFKIEDSSKKLHLAGRAFKINGKDAFVILPEKPVKPVKWVWYAPTVPRYPAREEKWMFEKFLEKGIAIAGIDVGESYGSPKGRSGYNELYQYLTTQMDFDPKPCLLARSRGGLMLYNWAVENPDSVSGIAAIFPVCNLESYPGLEKAAPAYAMTKTDLKRDLASHNPISRLKPLADAGVPLFHLHGDIDKVVPYEQNTKILLENYKALGGVGSCDLIKGQGHNLWQGWFKSQKLIDFVISAVHTKK